MVNGWRLFPIQLIYQGKTTRSLPHFEFPEDWHLFIREIKTLPGYIYTEKIILPYLHKERN